MTGEPLDFQRENNSEKPDKRRTGVLVIAQSTWLLIKRIFVGAHRWRQTIFEMSVLAIWALIVGSPYLNLDPRVIPAGREFGSAIQSHQLWVNFKECGWCGLWNSSLGGGSPAFADVYGSALHPIVILTTSLFGIINGAKIALVFAFWIAGVAQWWIAKELRVGWLPRMWSAVMAITAGHLAGRMEMGVLGVLFSTSLCSLVFGGVIRVARKGGRKSILVLAIVIASALVSGQGYIQIGLFFLLPTGLVLMIDKDKGILPVWKDYILAVVIGVLLASPYLVPLVHFLPNLGKFTDPAFSSAQSLEYLPLNLVINSADFYRSEMLDKLPYPYLYSLYIGWVPFIFALIGFSVQAKKSDRLAWFMFLGAGLAFFVASALPLKWLVELLPSLAGIRQPSLIAGLSIPLILGLSAYGLEYILQLEWPTIWMKVTEKSTKPGWRFSLRGLLIFPLIFSLLSAYRFTQHWVYTDYLEDHIFRILDRLETESLQWVNPPFGEHKFIVTGIERGLKMSPGVRPWNWKEREIPTAFLEAFRDVPPEGSVQVDVVDQVGIYMRPDQHYAVVIVGDQPFPCTSTGSGGSLTVLCETHAPGKLVVKENTWSGWKAWVDEERVALIGKQWLEVAAPAGEHTYQFRYRPWDVPVGLFLFFVGVCVCATQLYNDSKQRANPVIKELDLVGD